MLYLSHVKVAEALATALTTAGVMVTKYHGKLGPRIREQAHIDFLTGVAPVIVATIAFGMVQWLAYMVFCSSTSVCVICCTCLHAARVSIVPGYIKRMYF